MPQVNELWVMVNRENEIRTVNIAPLPEYKMFLPIFRSRQEAREFMWSHNERVGMKTGWRVRRLKVEVL